MPILDVEIVTHESPGPALAGALADMAGAVFGGPPGTTWVRVRMLSPSCYAENGTPEPAGHGAVFVTVLKASPPEGAALEAEIKALTEGVAAVCSRAPENVHILYEPAAQGRIAFGGKLRV